MAETAGPSTAAGATSKARRKFGVRVAPFLNKSKRLKHARSTFQQQIIPRLLTLHYQDNLRIVIFAVDEDNNMLSFTTPELKDLPTWIEAEETLLACSQKYKLDASLNQRKKEQTSWVDLPDELHKPLVQVVLAACMYCRLLMLNSTLCGLHCYVQTTH